jgi:hypothetical protein
MRTGDRSQPDRSDGDGSPRFPTKSQNPRESHKGMIGPERAIGSLVCCFIRAVVPYGKHSMIPAFGIIAEIYQTIAVVDLDVQKAQHRETENAGSFRTNSVAYVGKVNG